MGADGAPGDPGDPPLPPSRRWYYPQRRRDVRLFLAGSVLSVAAVVLLLFQGGDMRWLLISLFAFQTVNFGFQAWSASHTWLEADAMGLHVSLGRSRVTYPWEDITEVRPSIARGRRRTHLVAVRRTGPVVDLPVTEEALEELRRRHAAAR